MTTVENQQHVGSEALLYAFATIANAENTIKLSGTKCHVNKLLRMKIETSDTNMLILPIDNVDLREKVVVLRQHCVPPHSKLWSRVHRVAGGPGANSNASDSTVWVYTRGRPGSQTGYKRKDIQGYVNNDEEAAKYLMWNTLANDN